MTSNDKMLEDLADFDHDMDLGFLEKIALVSIIGTVAIVMSPFFLIFETINLLRK